MILPTDQIVSELRGFGDRVNEIKRPRDDRVFVPHDDWLDKFGAYLRQKNVGYVTAKMDCEDFALFAVTLATEALLAAQIPDDCGHSFGICDIGISSFGPGFLGVRPEGNVHTANLVRVRSGWRFFEPQNGFHMDVATALAKQEKDAAPAVTKIFWAWP